VRNERLRGSLSWEERVKETEELKDAANAQFQAGANEVALTAYLAAVWLLKPENPPAPNALASGIWSLRPEHPFCPSPAPEPHTPRGFESVRLIGEGDATPDVPETPEGGEGGEGSSSEAAGGEGWTEWMRWCASRKQLRELSSEAGSALGQKVVELRLSLHLNLAAAALRLDDWELANDACAFVLRRRPEQTKALYRQAAALKGLGELKRAAKLLEKLLALPGQARHADARRLHGEIHAASLSRAKRRDEQAQKQDEEMRAARQKIEDEKAKKIADEEAKKEAEIKRKEEREKELAESTQIREHPEIGAKVEVWWEGDQEWSKGTIVEKLGPDERPQFRVDYGDDFAMAHDLTSSDKFAKPYRLVAPPPPPPTRLMRVKTALRARAKLAMLGGGAVVAVVAVVVALMLQEQ